MSSDLVDFFNKKFKLLERVEKDAKFKSLHHMTAPVEQLILELLHEHEEFQKPVKALQKDTFASQYCGTMSFEIETRFGFLTLHVYNDCDEWDYIERVTFKHKDYYYPNMDVSPNRPWMTQKINSWRPRKEFDPRWGEPGF